MFEWVSRLFGRTREKPPSRGQAWADGFESFYQGQAHLEAGSNSEALACFDHAIAAGFQEAPVFVMRGGCLQEQDWHRDAIDDFERAISLEPDDANHFFQRAISRRAIGDREGCMSDFRQAIELVAAGGAGNRNYDDAARGMGWESAKALYEAELQLAEVTPGVAWERKRLSANEKGRRFHGREA